MILGIIASSISGSKVVTGSYESIATVTVGSGGTSSVSFSSIASTYSHLELRYLARTTRTGAAADYLSVYFNSDTAANYKSHYLLGTGSAADAGDAFGINTEATVFRVASADSGTSVFGSGVTSILDYANTSKYKTVRSLAGVDVNGTGGNIGFNSGLWMNTNAITSITIKATSGTTNIAQYSHFALYGIKA